MALEQSTSTTRAWLVYELTTSVWQCVRDNVTWLHERRGREIEFLKTSRALSYFLDKVWPCSSYHLINCTTGYHEKKTGHVVRWYDTKCITTSSMFNQMEDMLELWIEKPLFHLVGKPNSDHMQSDGLLTHMYHRVPMWALWIYEHSYLCTYILKWQKNAFVQRFRVIF